MLQILKQGYPSFLSEIIYLIYLIFYTLSQKKPNHIFIQILISAKITGQDYIDMSGEET